MDKCIMISLLSFIWMCVVCTITLIFSEGFKLVCILPSITIISFGFLITFIVIKFFREYNDE